MSGAEQTLKLRVFDPHGKLPSTVEEFSPDNTDHLLARMLEIGRALRTCREALPGASIVVGKDENNARCAAIALDEERCAVLLSIIKDGFPVEEWCSQGERESGSVQVAWEQWTSIPQKWFVLSDLATVALHDWLSGQVLSDLVAWSQDVS